MFENIVKEKVDFVTTMGGSRSICGVGCRPYLTKPCFQFFLHAHVMSYKPDFL